MTLDFRDPLKLKPLQGTPPASVDTGLRSPLTSRTKLEHEHKLAGLIDEELQRRLTRLT